MQAILKSYLKKLTNLSGNNRSLLLLRNVSDQTMDLHELDYQLNEPSFHIIEKLIRRDRQIDVSPLQDARDKDTGRISQRLRKLQRMDQFIFEERGSHDLYVGWPVVKGKLSDGTLIRCPLIFFPISLEQHKKNWVLHRRDDVNVTFNKSFILAYSYFNKIKLDEDLFENNLEDFDTDSTMFRTQLYQTFKDSSLELNFNQDNFINTLVPFTNYKKDEFDKLYHEGNLKLFPEAVLGIFPQSGSYQVPDYLKMIEQVRVKDMDHFFAEKSFDNDEGSGFFREYTSGIREEQIFNAFPLDTHQENALKTVRKGRSVVIQGPPGTGKTQLIANLVTDFMARGRKVLVVSQKKAALEVLTKRLRKIDLDPFIGVVHDFKDDRKSIFNKISHQIDRISEYRQLNNNLDTVYTERQFLQVCRNLDQLVEKLNEFKEALFDTAECGYSVKELYLTSDPKKPFIPLKTVYFNYTGDQIRDFSSLISKYFTYLKKFQQYDYPWKSRKSFHGLTTSDLFDIQATLRSIIPSMNGSLKNVNEAGVSITFEQLYQMVQNKDELESIIRSMEALNRTDYLMKLLDEEEEGLWFSNMERVVLSCYQGDGPEVTLKADDIGKIQKVLYWAMESLRTPWRWIRWLLTSDKSFLKETLSANGLRLNRKGVHQLSEKIDNRLNLEHNLSKLRAKEWLHEVPGPTDSLAGIQQWFTDYEEAIKLKQLITGVRNLKEMLDRSDANRFLEGLKALKSGAEEVIEMQMAWQKWLSPLMIKKIMEEPDIVEPLVNVLTRDFDAMVKFDEITHDMTSSDRTVMEALEEVVRDFNTNEAIEIFQNSIRLAWIAHIELKYPVLRIASNGELRQFEDDLRRYSDEKHSLTLDILYMQLRERTYKDMVFNRLNNPITYRELQHQVNKKRKIWPLRKVIETFDEELYNLIPAWFCSPEAVSAIFSVEQKFDLVIFDEASQCFAERGFPSLYRGAQLVVAGDDKQLTPNDLYRVRWEDEDEEDYALEVESLLDLCRHYLTQIPLRGHYRSKNFDLIDFSNRHFYGSKLEMLPDREFFNQNDPSITYNLISGVWENNSNRPEAEEVLNTLLSIADENPGVEIGVVTTNIHQQGLIIDLIDEALASGARMPEKYFVKNIENVQGDECDILILSVTYGRDTKGNINAHFGSLNQKGGENRLNVAITRARDRVIVMTSLQPEELKVENARNDGPKLLKEYLQYAREVSDGLYKVSLPKKEEQRRDWYLSEKIHNLCKDIKTYYPYALIRDFPSSDLAVKQKDKVLGLIITDDNFYYQSPTILDHHLYKPRIFEENNWPFHSIYSRQIWIDPAGIEEQLITFINKITSD